MQKGAWRRPNDSLKKNDIEEGISIDKVAAVLTSAEMEDNQSDGHSIRLVEVVTIVSDCSHNVQQQLSILRKGAL